MRIACIKACNSVLFRACLQSLASSGMQGPAMKDSTCKPAQARAWGVTYRSPEWEATPFPSMEVLIAAIWGFAVLVACNKRYVTPRNLDMLCLVLHLLCVLGLALTSARDADEYSLILFRVVYVRCAADLACTRTSICFGSHLVGLVVIYVRLLQPPIFEPANGYVEQTIVLTLAPLFGVVLLRQVGIPNAFLCCRVGLCGVP